MPSDPPKGDFCHFYSYRQENSDRMYIERNAYYIVKNEKITVFIETSIKMIKHDFLKI